MADPRPCSVPGCPNPARPGRDGRPGRHQCEAHKKRITRYGDVRADIPIRKSVP